MFSVYFHKCADSYNVIFTQQFFKKGLFIFIIIIII